MFAVAWWANANATNTSIYQDVTTVKNDSVAITKGDTTEYELIVFDPSFQSWFATHRKPIWYYDKEYYHVKNTLFTTYWNNLVINNRHRPPYDFEIEYDPTVDYGIEVNWQLFWYFKYLEEKYKIKLGP